MSFGDFSDREFLGVNNILDVLQRTQLMTRSLARREATVRALDSLSNDIGGQDAGQFRARDTSGRLRMIMSGLNLLTEYGISAYFAGFDEKGTPQFWANADNGTMAGGGGDVSMGDGGIIVLDHVPLEFKARNNFIGDLYSSYIFAQNSVGGLVLISNAKRGNTNLIVDGTFESGGTTNWDVSSATESIVTDHVHGGSYALKISPDSVPYHVIYSAARFAVTAGKIYLAQLYSDRNVDSADFIVEIEYYTAITGGSLISTDQVLREDRSTQTWQRSVGLPSVAPATATHARLRVQFGANAETWIDDIALVDAADVVWIQGTTSGWNMYGKFNRDASPITCNMLTRAPDSVGQGTWTRAVDGGAIYNASFYNSSNANGDNFTVNFRLPVGTYKLRFNATKAPSYGIVKVEVGSTNLGDTDLYAAAVNYLNIVEYTGIVIATGGEYAVKFTVNGRNASNTTGYFIDCSEIEFVRTA